MRFLLAVTCLTLLLGRPSLSADTPENPSQRWEKDIAAFEAQDKESPPPKDPVLFIGASGVKRWKTLASDFPELPVINRGFGGSQIIDAVSFADRIVIPYRPRVILLQSGGNDINAGKSPEEVAGDFQKFVEKVRSALPETPILFMSLQPSPARWAQADKQQETNRLIREYIAKGKRLTYIDAYDAFLNKEGQPREELFVTDRLHHNEEGYKLRVQIVKPHLAKYIKPAAAAAPQGPKPTLANVSYGPDPRQVIDFYQADSKGPTPVLVFIHGGGWMGGDKARVGGVPTYLAEGISVASVEYRFVSQAQAAGIKPPVQWPLHDAARALQFIRSKAKEWNIDKTRIAASGGSAGACSSLWLAFHDDMADPKSEDPVARESTRLLCAAVSGAQTNLDPVQMKEWMPNSNYGGHAFGFLSDTEGKDRKSAFQKFLEGRDKILPWIKEYSPYELVTSDDPPVYLFYGAPPAMGKEQKDPTHSANFGVGLQEKLHSVSVDCQLVYPDAPNVKYPLLHQYVIAMLKGANKN